MGPLLTEEERAGGAPITVLDRASVSLVRDAVRTAANAAGLDRTRTESLAAASSELAQNQIAHAHGGEVNVRVIRRAGVPGVEVIARDRGPGIADPTAALRGRPLSSQATPGSGLGVGLSAAHRLADELDLDVRWGEGTAVRARKFAGPLPRHEVAVLARACAGESVIGDDAAFGWRGDDLLVAVADGLGHGPSARQASAPAVELLAQDGQRPPLEILQKAHAALATTRGAVMATARIRPTTIDYAAAGNIGGHLHQARDHVRFASAPGVIGAPTTRLGRVNTDSAALHGRFVLVMFTDGLTSRLDLGTEPDLLREPPMVIAHRLLTVHGRHHDDALVLVAT